MRKRKRSNKSIKNETSNRNVKNQNRKRKKRKEKIRAANSIKIKLQPKFQVNKTRKVNNKHIQKVFKYHIHKKSLIITHI